ncbi:MAG: DNA polymerase III subunit delta', partial [Pseudomonadota bacterium]
VDDVRAVKSFLQLSAADGGWRAVIIDPGDALNRSAANAILKFLEEPPARTLILLVSHAPGGLLPTIRSRCRTLDLAPLGAQDLSAALAQAGVEIDAPEAPAMAELAGGSVGRAIRLAAGDGLALYAKLAGLLAPGRIDRHALTQLAEAAVGRDGPQTYPMLVDLTQTLAARLARAAALATPPPPAAPAETALAAKAASSPPQALLWAEASARASARFRHAVAVNLDPAQTIIDTFLDLDDTLARAQRA